MIEDFTLLLNEMIEPIIIYDISINRIIDVNQNFCKLIDYPQDKLLTLDDKKDVFGILSLIESIKNTENPKQEKLINKKDGTPIWVDIQQRKIKKNDHEYLIIKLRDIDERKNKEIELYNNLHIYQEIAENMLDLICSIDKDFVVTYASPSHKKILGYEPYELIGKSVFKCVHPDSVSQAIELAKDAIINKNDAIIELKYISKKKEERWLEASARPIYDENDDFKGAYISSRDITDKKNTEEQLQSVFRRIQNIFDFLPDPTFVIDINHRVIAWNHAIENMTGVKYENIILKGNYEHSLPFYTDRRPILIDFICNPSLIVAEYYSYFERDGDSIFAETYSPFFNNNSGAYLWGKASPLYDKNGNIEGAIESIRDITKYRKNEMALKESEERYRQIVDLSPDKIILLSENIVTYANHSAIKLFHKDILHQDFVEFMKNIINSEYHRLFIDNMKSIINNKINSIALEVQLKNGTERPIDLKIIGDSFLYLQKRVIQIIIVDITLQKSVQRTLQKNISEKEKHINNLKNEIEKLMSNENIESTIIGRSKETISLREFIKEVCDVDAHVLITGESGTGKELIAKSIHNSSIRKKQVFVPINCGAIPEELIESELFGHEEGAFTGAKKKKIGKVEYANGGTLFLDEIGDLSLILQVKLLRFLEDKIVVPVGGNIPTEVNVRVISATNKNLETLIAEGKFREDLFYRLNVLRIHIPPLRQRKEDILPLVMHFINVYNERYKKNVTSISDNLYNYLLNNKWKGNIRELENIISRLIVFSKQNILEYSSIISETGESFSNIDLNLSLKNNIEKLEKRLITDMLIKVKGNISKTSRTLDIDSKTLYSKMKKYDIDLKTIRKKIKQD